MVLSNKDKFYIDFFLPIDGTLTGTTTLDKSVPRSNGNERQLYIP